MNAIAFSLFNTPAKYSWGLLDNISLAKIHYPGWRVVVHVERGHYAIPRILAAGAEVIEHSKPVGLDGTFWRFETLADPRFERTLIRDADSRISDREAAAVREWIAAGTPLHIIRDAPSHYARPILGGMFGMKNGSLPGILDAIEAWQPKAPYGADEEFLAQTLSTLIPQATVHGSGKREIPLTLPSQHHIGQRVAPEWNQPFQAVVLNPDHYVKRMLRFRGSEDAHGGFLRHRIQRWRAYQPGEVVRPRCFSNQNHPHYYLATRAHNNIIERAILDQWPLTFVFEDDAEFAPDFEERFMQFWLALPPRWMGGLLGGTPNHAVRPWGDARVIRQAYGLLGMWAVMWTPEGLQRAWNHFQWHNRAVCDQALARLQKEEPHFYAPSNWLVRISKETAQYGAGD